MKYINIENFKAELRNLLMTNKLQAVVLVKKNFEIDLRTAKEQIADQFAYMGADMDKCFQVIITKAKDRIIQTVIRESKKNKLEETYVCSKETGNDEVRDYVNDVINRYNNHNKEQKIRTRRRLVSIKEFQVRTITEWINIT